MDSGAVHKVQCRLKNKIRFKGGEGVGANVMLFITSRKPTSLLLFYMDPEFQSGVSMFGKFCYRGRGGLAKMIMSFVFW